MVRPGGGGNRGDRTPEAGRAARGRLPLRAAPSPPPAAHRPACDGRGCGEGRGLPAALQRGGGACRRAGEAPRPRGRGAPSFELPVGHACGRPERYRVPWGCVRGRFCLSWHKPSSARRCPGREKNRRGKNIVESSGQGDAKKEKPSGVWAHADHPDGVDFHDLNHSIQNWSPLPYVLHRTMEHKPQCKETPMKTSPRRLHAQCRVQDGA
ncbi:uncharacterized protein LOC125146603 [Prionailurus viverrinus]|uniref:uncharacterized protein LOC125146603 n=1 Tax=Prionailurus viverrinus TaxID=61388 RepID=UPI001FF1779A|nr:uncharacterized protein LOC125146603 [Prionailurus viverrinus]